MNPRVTRVKANPDFTLKLTFENGEKGVFDMKPYLSIGVFRQLKNLVLFKKVKPYYGSISWSTGQDLDPDMLYLDSKKVRFSAKTSSVPSFAEPKVRYAKKSRKK